MYIFSIGRKQILHSLLISTITIVLLSLWGIIANEPPPFSLNLPSFCGGYLASRAIKMSDDIINFNLGIKDRLIHNNWNFHFTLRVLKIFWFWWQSKFYHISENILFWNASHSNWAKYILPGQVMSSLLRNLDCLEPDIKLLHSGVIFSKEKSQLTGVKSLAILLGISIDAMQLGPKKQTNRKCSVGKNTIFNKWIFKSRSQDG